MGWIEVESNDAWNPETGDEIQGMFMQMEEGGKDTSRKYLLNTEDGEKFFWGCTMLDQKMRNVKPGEYVRVKYNGLKMTKGGREMKDYSVWYYEEESAPYKHKPKSLYPGDTR